jgi:hypothetical protein
MSEIGKVFLEELTASFQETHEKIVNVFVEELHSLKQENQKLKEQLALSLELIRSYGLGHSKYCGSPNEECDCGSDEDYEKFLKTLEEK